jgi:hypothetical protein
MPQDETKGRARRISHGLGARFGTVDLQPCHYFVSNRFLDTAGKRVRRIETRDLNAPRGDGGARLKSQLSTRPGRNTVNDGSTTCCYIGPIETPTNTHRSVTLNVTAFNSI